MPVDYFEETINSSNYRTDGEYICEECEERKEDNINHPSHYTSGKIEVIDFIDDQHLNYEKGNAVKYICRAGKKDPNKEIEDLKKAVWYLNREISNLENK